MIENKSSKGKNALKNKITGIAVATALVGGVGIMATPVVAHAQGVNKLAMETAATGTINYSIQNTIGNQLGSGTATGAIGSKDTLNMPKIPTGYELVNITDNGKVVKGLPEKFTKETQNIVYHVKATEAKVTVKILINGKVREVKTSQMKVGTEIPSNIVPAGALKHFQIKSVTVNGKSEGNAIKGKVVGPETVVIVDLIKRDTTPVKKPDVAPAKKDTTPVKKPDVAPAKKDTTPVKKPDVAPEKKDTTPVKKPDVAPAKKDITPVKKPEVVPAKKDTTPVNKPDVAPAKKDITPVNKPDVTPAKKDKAPVNKPEVVPAKKDTTPVNKPDVTPAKKDTTSVKHTEVVPTKKEMNSAKKIAITQTKIEKSSDNVKGNKIINKTTVNKQNRNNSIKNTETTNPKTGDESTLPFGIAFIAAILGIVGINIKSFSKLKRNK